MEQLESEVKTPSINEIVSIPTANNVDRLAEAFFKTTGHGKLVEWKKFNENFPVQSRFFEAGTFAILQELCKMAGVAMDMSLLKAELIRKILNDEPIYHEGHGKITNIS
jgi:hypothetical protein